MDPQTRIKVTARVNCKEEEQPRYYMGNEEEEKKDYEVQRRHGHSVGKTATHVFETPTRKSELVKPNQQPLGKYTPSPNQNLSQGKHHQRSNSNRVLQKSDSSSSK